MILCGNLAETLNFCQKWLKTNFFRKKFTFCANYPKRYCEQTCKTYCASCANGAKKFTICTRKLGKKIWSFRENPTLDSGTSSHDELSFCLFIKRNQKKESMVRAEDRKTCGLTIHVCMAE